MVLESFFRRADALEVVQLLLSRSEDRRQALDLAHVRIVLGSQDGVFIGKPLLLPLHLLQQVHAFRCAHHRIVLHELQRARGQRGDGWLSIKTARDSFYTGTTREDKMGRGTKNTVQATVYACSVANRARVV